MPHEPEQSHGDAPHAAVGAPEWHPAGPATGPANMNLFCPGYAYPLVAVEDIGMTECPDCGAAIDFDHLRRLRVEKVALGDFWQLFWSVM